MSTSTIERAYSEPRQYGNFGRQRTFGLGKLNRGGTVLLVVLSAFVFLLFMFVGTLIKLALVVLLIIVGLLIYNRDINNMTTYQKIVERQSFMWNRRRGRNVFKNALLGKNQLPPPLSGTYLTEHVDGYSRAFSLVHYPHSSQVAVVLKCQPSGGELHDEDEVDRMVAAWGGFGAMFADQPGVSQYTSTVEVGPAFGATAESIVESMMDPNAPEVAKRITRATTASGTVARTSVTSFVTVTFDVPERAAKAAKKSGSGNEIIAGEVLMRLPQIIEQLKLAGAGSVVPAHAGDLPEHVRVAFDPQMAGVVESARAAHAETSIEWDDSGPSSAVSEWDFYAHDSGTSITYRMTQGPTATIPHDCLRTLLAPHPSIHRKRVTLVRRVLDAADAIDEAESAYNNARTRAEGNRATAADRTAQTQADRIRNDVTTGSALEDFNVLITITVLDPEELPEAASIIEHSLSRQARLRVRRMYGNQELGFAAALGIGFDLNAHDSTSNLKKAIQ